MNREALLAGEVDAFAEYNGTGWTLDVERDYEALVGEDGSVDPDALTEAVARQHYEELTGQTAASA